jgi:hypothetical protein
MIEVMTSIMPTARASMTPIQNLVKKNKNVKHDKIYKT